MGLGFNRKYQKALRRKLRNEASLYERILWSKLRGRQLEGRKFRRQAGFGKYVVDFYCPSEKLVVELDGSYHCSEKRQNKDQERDLFFEKLGVKVIRIANPVNSETLEDILKTISSHFASQ